jgi:hypothetical protein
MPTDTSTNTINSNMPRPCTRCSSRKCIPRRTAWPSRRRRPLKLGTIINTSTTCPCVGPSRYQGKREGESLFPSYIFSRWSIFNNQYN